MPTVGPFVRTAVDALVQSDRLRLGADAAIAPADALTRLPALIVAPADPVRVGAANRALERLNVPWRFGAAKRETGTVREPASVTSKLLDGVDRHHALSADAQLATPPRTRWRASAPSHGLSAVIGMSLSHRLSIRRQRTFQCAPAFFRGSPRQHRSGSRVMPAYCCSPSPGARLRAPAGVQTIDDASGQAVPIASGEIIAPDRAGVYFLRRAGAKAGAVVVNSEPDESTLARLPAATFRARFDGRDVSVTADGERWARRRVHRVGAPTSLHSVVDSRRARARRRGDHRARQRRPLESSGGQGGSVVALPTLIDAVAALPAFARVLNTVPEPGRRLTIGGLAGLERCRRAGRARASSADAVLRRRRPKAFRRQNAGSPTCRRFSTRRLLRCIRRVKDSVRSSPTPRSPASEWRRWSVSRAETSASCSRRPARCSSARGCRRRLRGARLEIRKGDVRRPEEIAAASRACWLRARADGRRCRAVLGARRHLRHLRLRHGRPGAPRVLGRRDRRASPLRPAQPALHPRSRRRDHPPGRRRRS